MQFRECPSSVSIRRSIGADDRVSQQRPIRYQQCGIRPRAYSGVQQAFAVAYDARRRQVLWSENDGKLKFLNLATSEKGTLLALSNRYCLTRLHLCTTGDALVCDIARIGLSNSGEFVLAVLDYPRLLQRGGVEAVPPVP